MRTGAAGATRTCPHCKATILESAEVCPSCKHYLRFEPVPGTGPTTTALQVEGMIRHPAEGGAWEYCVVLTIVDDTGAEVARHVVGVGAMHAGEERSFKLAVQVMPTTDTRRAAKAGMRH
jgi:hypothetical protein